MAQDYYKPTEVKEHPSLTRALSQAFNNISLLNICSLGCSAGWFCLYPVSYPLKPTRGRPGLNESTSLASWLV